VAERVLGALGRQDLGVRVEGHAKPLLEEPCDGLAETGVAAIQGVLVGGGVGHGTLGRLDDERRRRRVRVAYP